jgi:hypothetical protein
MSRSLQSHGKRSRIYVPVLLYIFKQKYVPGSDIVEFTLKDVAEACTALGIVAANPPDVIYRMKSRTLIPEDIQALGFRVIRPIGRGKYVLEKAESTLITFPIGDYEIIEDQTPSFVRKLLGSDLGLIDEQGLLAIIRYNHLIAHFLQARVYHLKGHVRRSVIGVGQAEVDDVHIALPFDIDEPVTIVPVEAKAKDEPVNRAQIAMQILYAREAFPGHPIRPLTIKLFPDGEILFMEFADEIRTAELEPIAYARYRIEEPQVKE